MEFKCRVSRWVFKCHTVQQIIIGAALGTFFGFSAFKLKDYVLFVINKSFFNVTNIYFFCLNKPI